MVVIVNKKKYEALKNAIKELDTIKARNKELEEKIIKYETNQREKANEEAMEVYSFLTNQQRVK